MCVVVVKTIQYGDGWAPSFNEPPFDSREEKMKFEGQVALIVGGARGIGETIAHTFSKEGASLVLVDLERMKPQLDAWRKRSINKAAKRSPSRPTAATIAK